MAYDAYVTYLKAMADPNRLQIIDLLSCGTLCACDILPHFEFSQPTLSHHMKVLKAAGIVTAEKKGRWQYYTLNSEFTQHFKQTTAALFAHDEACICHTKNLVNEKGCCSNEKNRIV